MASVRCEKYLQLRAASEMLQHKKILLQHRERKEKRCGKGRVPDGATSSPDDKVTNLTISTAPPARVRLAMDTGGSSAESLVRVFAW
jgi:hypothetical protein